MFQDTRPADPGQLSGGDHWAEFRIDDRRAICALLRQLRDRSTPVNVVSPDGAMLCANVWTIDEDRSHLNLSAEAADPQLAGLVEGNEAVAVAYLDSVKLQFDLLGLVLVRSARSCALQARLPREMYRFQRRNSFRVRTLEQHSPTAHLRHPSIPDMTLNLRVLDVSAGGCAIYLPSDVPPLPPGCELAGVQIALDADTRFTATVRLQHVTSIGVTERGVRLGCEWAPLDGASSRALQRYIDLTQRRRRLLSGG